ncbi:ArsR/SmtB family transcription factor [Jatrophihabitans sp. DSM 45814]
MVQYSVLDVSFAALSDPTRRGILHRLGEGRATVSELAEKFEMTLTGMRKHIQLLEQADLVVTEKHGRTRYCELSRNSLDRELAWIDAYRSMVNARMDRLEEFLNRTETKS